MILDSGATSSLSPTRDGLVYYRPALNCFLHGVEGGRPLVITGYGFRQGFYPTTDGRAVEYWSRVGVVPASNVHLIGRNRWTTTPTSEWSIYEGPGRYELVHLDSKAIVPITLWQGLPTIEVYSRDTLPQGSDIIHGGGDYPTSLVQIELDDHALPGREGYSLRRRTPKPRVIQPGMTVVVRGAMWDNNSHQKYCEGIITGISDKRVRNNGYQNGQVLH